MAEITAFAQALSPVAFLIACGGLLAACLFEQTQLLAKYWGARAGAVATGYNNAMKLMVANRVGAVTYLFFVALAIDIGTEPDTIRISLASTIVLVGLTNLVLLVVHKRALQPDQSSSARRLFSVAAFKRGQYVALFGAAASSLFNFSGLTIPMIWSASYPELRLTLANTGFIFNSIFTFINVFLVENEIAKLIDRDDAAIRPMVSYILLARFIAALIAAPIILSV